MNILIIGANGQVGSALLKTLNKTGHQCIGLTRKELDCCNLKAIYSILLQYQPNLIINAAAYTAVDKAEEDKITAYQINAHFVEALALYCYQKKIPLIHLSTDYVFDGNKTDAYTELDRPNPATIYGQSKLDGEQAIISNLEQFVILRVSWVFGSHGNNFVKNILKLASSRKELSIVNDQWGRPTAALDIARVIHHFIIMIDSRLFAGWGLYHYASEGIINWYEFAVFFINLAQEKNKSFVLAKLSPIQSENYCFKTPRPKNSVLNTKKIEDLFKMKCNPWNNYLPEIIDDWYQNLTEAL